VATLPTIAGRPNRSCFCRAPHGMIPDGKKRLSRSAEVLPRPGERPLPPFERKSPCSIAKSSLHLSFPARPWPPWLRNAAPSTTKAAPCILREHRITSVTPYRVEGHQGRVVVQELRGATVSVQAEPGLTAEWLQLTLSRHLAAMRAMGGMKDCAFEVNDVQVKVAPRAPASRST